MVVAVRDLDDQTPVGTAQPQTHRRGAVLEGVRHEFAGGEDAEVAQFDREAPAGEDARREGTRAWGGLHSAEELQGRVVEELGVRSLSGGVLDHQDRHVVVVLRGDAERTQQPVADDLRGAERAGQGALQCGDAFVDVLAAAFDQTVRIEDGGGAGGRAIVPEVCSQPPVPSGGRWGPRRGGPRRPRP